jgi:hypothetical protein
MIREHIRSHVVGYMALFVALGGTAAATHPGGADTISSEDIINGQVKTNDISNSNGVRSADVRDDTESDGGLAAVDLAADSVGHAEILGGAVGSPELAVDSVLAGHISQDAVGSSEIVGNGVSSSELAASSVGAEEVATNAVGAAEIAADSVASSELAQNAVNSSHLPAGAVGTEEIRSNAVTSGHIGAGVVGAGELVEVHENWVAGTVYDNTNEHDGAWGQGSATVSCGAGEQLLGASLEWIDTVGHHEATLKEIRIERAGNDSATVVAIHDAGDVYASFRAVATCIGVA